MCVSVCVHVCYSCICTLRASERTLSSCPVCSLPPVALLVLWVCMPICGCCFLSLTILSSAVYLVAVADLVSLFFVFFLRGGGRGLLSSVSPALPSLYDVSSHGGRSYAQILPSKNTILISRNRYLPVFDTHRHTQTQRSESCNRRCDERLGAEAFPFSAS